MLIGGTMLIIALIEIRTNIKNMLYLSLYVIITFYVTRKLA